jgi:hypothetical protein
MHTTPHSHQTPLTAFLTTTCVCACVCGVAGARQCPGIRRSGCIGHTSHCCQFARQIWKCKMSLFWKFITCRANAFVGY